ncbi:transcriptional regulator [Streptomyces calvus]|jgi:transcriptional regulator with XRE-family HTH domain|uniref:Transcriptional regulator n=1 Tax=Streptomyces calvus TaxID=67282 RepID=A0A514JN91_9ACTN|nr:helix-turn-helix transcriptional regulator [Streptomyces calvus]QDI68796.1 transcriptional regulator [Streptomyces calvus]
MPSRNFDPDALRRIRRERGLTQVALAAALGRSFTAISMYENGRSTPPVDVLAAIADTLDAPMDAFVTGPARELVSA